jgi:hypothetical protein
MIESGPHSGWTLNVELIMGLLSCGPVLPKRPSMLIIEPLVRTSEGFYSSFPNSRLVFFASLFFKPLKNPPFLGGFFILRRLVSQVLFLDNNLSNALKPRSSGKPLITLHSEVAAGRIAPFHSYLTTFRVERST